MRSIASGIEYTLPVRMRRPPVVVVNNEFFIVPGANSFANAGNFIQNRFQAGIRLPVTDSFAIRALRLATVVAPQPAGTATVSLASRSPLRSASRCFEEFLAANTLRPPRCEMGAKLNTSALALRDNAG